MSGWNLLFLILVSVVMLFAIVHGFFKWIAGRRIPEEKLHTPLFSVRCSVRSPNIGMGAMSIDAEVVTASPARLTLYKDFMVIKTFEGLVFKRDKTLFKTKKSHLGYRLYISEGELGDIEICSKQERILAALKSAGYQVSETV